MNEKKIKTDDIRNEGEPTACTDFAPHSAVWHFHSCYFTTCGAGGWFVQQAVNIA